MFNVSCKRTSLGKYETLPKQINLENIKDIVQYIDSIYSQAVMSYAMPPGNITFLENSERKTLYDLYNFLKRL